MSPTPSPTDFNHDACTSYNLELSDFTQIKDLITSDIESTRFNTFSYRYNFENPPTKSSEWLLSSSTYTNIDGTSSLSITVDIVECVDPFITVTDNDSFVAIIFSLVFV